MLENEEVPLSADIQTGAPAPVNRRGPQPFGPLLHATGTDAAQPEAVAATGSTGLPVQLTDAPTRSPSALKAPRYRAPGWFSGSRSWPKILRRSVPGA